MSDRKVLNLRNIIGICISILILIFILKILFQTWREVPIKNFHLNPSLLILSYIFLFLSFAISAYIWKNLLAGLNQELNFKKSLKIMALSQLGRYIPGHIWSYMGRGYLSAKELVSVKNTFFSMLLETMLLITTASLISGIYVFSQREYLENRFKFIIPLFIIVIPIEIICLFPSVLKRILSFVAKIFRKELLSFSFSNYKLFQLLTLYCLAWCFTGLGFFIFLQSIYYVDITNILVIISSYVFAWILGFLSFITPSGLGVREGVLVFLLVAFLPVPVAISISLLSRIWTTLFEVICAVSLLKV